MRAQPQPTSVNGSFGISSQASMLRGTPRLPSPGQASRRGGPLARGGQVSPSIVFRQPRENPVRVSCGLSTCTW